MKPQDRAERAQILLTNDDGIQSPGLWAAAEALSKLGYVTIAAPRDQVSGSGRSLPRTSDGRIEKTILQIGGQEWPVYSIGGSPAQTVQHAVYEIMPRLPDLVVSGINYGENVGTGITISGTVGAALEAAAIGIPALAVSLQLVHNDYLSYSNEDFTSAGSFTGLFARMLLEHSMPEDVDLLKVEVPHGATPHTPWKMTRLARHRYYEPVIRRSGAWDEPYYIEGIPRVSIDEVAGDSDIAALVFERVVSVTPLSLDMTSRVDLNAFEAVLRKTEQGA